MSEQSLSSPQPPFPETALDGVRYARMESRGQQWRMASLSPHWREELPLLGENPAPETLKSLESKDIFLNSAPRPKLAVMCCGLGSAWPGMGRELYDNFPAAREAMDKLAAYADWDLLSVMDETESERLNHFRVQIPYLFMLEYAQWSQLKSLGFAPDLLCGHSLGELVALSLSGSLPMDAAWHLFDIRSVHMDNLEKNSSNESGMLTVPADYEIVRQALQDYPDLHISNCNTSRQYILGGPKKQLLELRKNLRRMRIPAFMLGINLAFHNPAMRILRGLSVRRLNGLDIQAPQIPVLSCINAAPYPQTASAICRSIADLDENTVDWPKTIGALRDKYQIRHFLELGPQETLCGLNAEIYPEAQCISTSRKGHETKAMRELCARLYSLGLLQEKMLLSAASRKTYPLAVAGKAQPKTEQEAPESQKSNSAEWDIVMELLAEESGQAIQNLRPDLDLRYDLALRSSRFPYLVQEAERRFKRQIPLENLLQISTVGDLANFLTGSQTAEKTEQTPSNSLYPFERPSPFLLPPLRVYKGKTSAEGSLEAWRLDPDVPGLAVELKGPIALCVLDEDIFPQIWSGMAPFALPLLIPEFLLPKSGPLEKSASAQLPIEIGSDPSPQELKMALEKACKENGPPQGILFIPPPLNGSPEQINKTKKFLNLLPEFKKLYPKAWLCCLQRDNSSSSMEKQVSLERAKEFFSLADGKASHAIYWVDQRSLPTLQNQIEAGDLLARELLYASPPATLWLSQKRGELSESPVYCPTSSCMDIVQTDPTPRKEPLVGAFSGLCQFSAYAEPALATHGALSQADATNVENGAPFLPLGHILKSILNGAQLISPWLVASAISDVSLQNFPLLPPGLVRECRLEVSGQQWLKQEKRLARLCHCSLEARELSANGRRTQNWLPVCEASCILRPPSDSMADYYRSPVFTAEVQEAPTTLLENFYKALNFGSDWQILKRLFFPKEKPAEEERLSWQAELAPIPARIARSSDWEYAAFAYLVEAIWQALSLNLAMGENSSQERELRAELRKWRCSRIGFMRFVNSLEQYSEPLILRFTRSWHTPNFTRFEGGIETKSEKTLLSFLHFEFDRVT